MGKTNHYYTSVLDARTPCADSKQGTSVRNHIGIIAHEINNPLDGVIRYVNLASYFLSEENTLKSMECLSEAGRGLQSITKIVRDLSLLSQSFSQDVQLVDINQEVRKTCESLADYIADRYVEVRQDLYHSAPCIPDYGLSLVFKNIITNACDAMRRGGVLTITTVQESGSFKIVFSDTGTGISSESLHKIFEPFFTTKKSGEGTGLGLALASEIVQKYQGTISVASEYEQGTTVSITIPTEEEKGEL